MSNFWDIWCASCDSIANFVIPKLPYIMALGFTLGVPFAIISIIYNLRRKPIYRSRRMKKGESE